MFGFFKKRKSEDEKIIVKEENVLKEEKKQLSSFDVVSIFEKAIHFNLVSEEKLDFFARIGKFSVIMNNMRIVGRSSFSYADIDITLVDGEIEMPVARTNDNQIIWVKEGPWQNKFESMIQELRIQVKVKEKEEEEAKERQRLEDERDFQIEYPYVDKLSEALHVLDSELTINAISKAYYMGIIRPDNCRDKNFGKTLYAFDYRFDDIEIHGYSDSLKIKLFNEKYPEGILVAENHSDSSSIEWKIQGGWIQTIYEHLLFLQEQTELKRIEIEEKKKQTVEHFEKLFT